MGCYFLGYSVSSVGALETAAPSTKLRPVTVQVFLLLQERALTLRIIFSHGSYQWLQNPSHLSPDAAEGIVHDPIPDTGIRGHRRQAVVTLKPGMAQPGVPATLVDFFISTT